MNVYIKDNTNYYYPILYVLKIIEKNRGIKFIFLNSAENADIIWCDKNDKSEDINTSFYEMLSANAKGIEYEKLFNSEGLIIDRFGNNDLISTIFYLINCLQEIKPEDDNIDDFGRFKYISSYQYRLKNIEENIVENLIDLFCNKHNIKGEKTHSTFFISHDIDSIYGSFFQDGFWALKNMKIGVVLNLIIYELSRNPHWRNIDKIIKLNDEHDIKSTFFWLVNKGVGTQKIKNADYNVNKEKDLLSLVENSNNINGLHKSCSNMSINNELNKGGLSTTFNRYHFLNFLPHKDWTEISESKLNFDCSLGFAEHYGFRNSYGKAFQPYDIANNKPYDFVEAPLNFMDGTFHKYMNIPTPQIANLIIDFYEKNPLNCDFSLLWHNTSFTNFKYNSLINEYKKVISYIYETKIECVSPQDLILKNRLEW